MSEFAIFRSKQINEKISLNNLVKCKNKTYPEYNGASTPSYFANLIFKIIPSKVLQHSNHELMN